MQTPAGSIPRVIDARYRGTVLAVLFRPWTQISTWWALVFGVTDIVIGHFLFLPVLVLLILSISLLVVFPIALPVIWLTFTLAHVFAQVERTRIATFLGLDLVDPVPPLQSTTWWSRLWERVRGKPRWREIGYFALLQPLGTLTSVAVLLVWCGSAALVALPFYAGELPGGTAKFWLFEVGPGAGAWLATAVGLVGLALAAPWLTIALARLGAAAARRLLAVPEHDKYEARVHELETSRVAAVDTAEAERRRIERDLHDGAQQRLVSLAMTLGSARERLETDPEAGRKLVDAAHQESKAALEELRNLVRGIHPVILEDRGLDAALSAVVARSPVPVNLQVEVTHRPPAPVESTAYFVVAEALTNIARHAHASQAWVAIVRLGDKLIVEIRDDGRGGADESAGTGLHGLRDRVASLGGTMRVMSPEGGPTTLLVEMPCGS